MNQERNWATVATPRTVYVGIVDRSEFDRIASPMTDHRLAAEPHNRRDVLTKTVEQHAALGVTVVFQHWVS
jgi:hypothetical protein